MKSSHLLTTFIVATAALAASAFGQTKTFTVEDGASPWHDRVGMWTLHLVPDTLRSTAPLPQQSCTSRGLEVPGTPKMILIGVAERDLAAFKSKFSAAKLTGESLAVKDIGGLSLPYQVLQFENPPPKIEGGGTAGLILLKVVAPNATGLPKARPVQSPG